MKLEELIDYKIKIETKIDLLYNKFEISNHIEDDESRHYNTKLIYVEIEDLYNKLSSIKNIINNYMVNVFEIKTEIKNCRNLIELLKRTKYKQSNTIQDSVFTKIELDNKIEELYNKIEEKIKMIRYYIRITDITEEIEII
jgi:hypothetical protein